MKYQILEKETANLIRLRSDSGLEVSFSEIGASIVEIRFAGAPMTIAPKDLNEFNGPNSGYFGKTPGRITGRIAKSLLHFEGKDYKLQANEGTTSLHGGPHGFSTKRFISKVEEKDDGIHVIFTYDSPDGDGGYPGSMKIKVSYFAAKNKPSLRIDYEATSDRDTPLNLTNHAYFNLGGFRHVLDSTLYLRASKYLPVDANMIPLPPQNVPPCLDFQHGKRLGEEISDPLLQNSPTKGYDHGFIFDSGDEAKHKAILSNEHYLMEVFTDAPAVQVYSDNYPRLNMPLTNGHKEGPHSGITLECVDIPGDFEGGMLVSPKKPYKRFAEFVFAKKEKHQ